MRSTANRADHTVEGARNEDTLRQAMNAVNQAIAASSGSTVDTATPATPFITDQKPGRFGIRVEMAFDIPFAARKIWVTIVETANPRKKHVTAWHDLTETERDDHYMRRFFDADLKPSTEYGVYMVETQDLAGTRSQLPEHDPEPDAYLVTFATSAVFAVAPETPSLANILLNRPYLADGINGNVEFEYKLWVDHEHVARAGELDLDDAFIRLTTKPFDDESSVEDYHAEFTDERVIEDGKALKIRAILSLGTEYEIKRSFIKYAAGKIPSANPATPIRFFAGGKVADEDADIPEPTFSSITLLDSHNTRVVEHIPNTDGVLLKKNRIEISYDGGTNWETALVENVRAEENLDIAGTYDLVRVIQHKKNRHHDTWLLRATLWGVGRIGVDNHNPKKTTQVANYASFSPSLDDAAAPTSLHTPVVKAKPFGIHIKGVFADVAVDTLQYNEIVIKVVDNAGALIGYLDTATNTLTASEATAKLRIGDNSSKDIIISTAQWIAAFGGPANRNVRVYYYSTNLVGTSAASADSTNLAFSALNLDPASVDTAAPTIPAAPDLIAKPSSIKFKGKRPTSQMNFFVKNEVVIRVKNSGGTILGYIIDQNGGYADNGTSEFKNDLGPDLTHTFNIKRSDVLTLYPLADTGTLEFYHYITNSAGTSAASSARSVSISTWEADPLAPDPAAPSAPAAPNVQEYFGKFTVTADAPASNITTLLEYQYVMSTSSSPPVGDPTVGSEGVLNKKKSGGAVNFQRKMETPVNLFFYVRARNSTAAFWSAYSPATSVSASSISRPLQDGIGSGVPILPERLEINGSSGTGHTSTTFVLPSGASSVDDFYNNMALHVTGASASDRIQSITDYVGSTRTCTVSPGFGSTPSGSVTYEVHRISVTGDRCGRSSTGHDTTHIFLDSGASSVDDFYNAYSIYIPSLASGDRIRKVDNYVGSTRRITVDVAFSGSPSGNLGYILINGSFGTANPDETGIISPAPFRWWLDGETDQDIIEGLLPNDENGFSLTDAELRLHQSNSAGTVKQTYPLKTVTGTTFIVKAPTGYGPVAEIRFRNQYRTGGSDGWSERSCYVRIAKSASAGGTPNYNPDAFTPVLIDFQGEASYPKGRYPTY